MTESELIVTILAQADAIWYPWRVAKPPVTGHLYRAREAYESCGVRFRPDLAGLSSGSTERKATERLLADSEAAGLVTTTRQSAYRIGTLLTDTGEARARELLGMPEFAVTAAVYGELVEQARYRGGALVPELDLTETTFDDDHETRKGAAIDVEEALVPLLRRQIVTANSNGQGNTFYRPRCPNAALPAATAEPVIASDELNSLYLRALRAEQQRVSANTDNVTELGRIPLPTGWWPDWHDEPASFSAHRCGLCDETQKDDS